LINEISNGLKAINSSTPISYENLGDIEILQGLLKSNPSLISSGLTNMMDDFITNQIDLITTGKADLSPEVLKLLDLGLFLTK